MERINQLQLVSYEIAKKLKEVGFNWECTYAISYKGVDNSYDSIGNNKFDLENVEAATNSLGYNHYLAPTLALVQKWLREVHNIIVLIDHFYHPVKTRYAASLHTFEIRDIRDGFTWFDSYEQALEEGIIEALKLVNSLILVYGSPYTETGKQHIVKNENCYFQHECGIYIHKEHNFLQCPICGSRDF